MRRILTIFMALMLSFTWASAESKGGRLVYDQMGDLTAEQYGFNSCQGYGWQAQTAYGADDFTVTADGMDIYGATALLGRSDLESIQVIIYNDDNGKPGTEVEAFRGMTYEMTDLGSQVYQYTVEFPYAVELDEGTYWFTMAGYGQWMSSQWFLLDDASDIGLKAQHKQVTNMMGNIDPLAAWQEITVDDAMNGVSNGNGTYNNLAFGLVGPPDDNDLSLKTIISPESGELTATHEITVAIENVGLLTQTSYDVMYQVSTTIDDVLTLVKTATETVTTSIANKEIVEYTFTNTADMSAVTDFSVKATVILATDTNSDNDAAYVDVTNFGEITQMRKDTIVTTCGGIFVDNGGVTGNYTGGIDTTTILPGTEGARIALDFVYWNIYYYDYKYFTIYDGATTDAPILFETRYGNVDREVQNPGYVQARNAGGALTIVMEINSWASGTYEGFIANVSCETANAIEFMALDVTVGEPAGFNIKGEPVDVLATVTNAGADTTSRYVYLIENNVVVDTMMTVNLIPGMVDSLHFNWIPSMASNDLAIKVLIQNDPQDSNDDNALYDTVSVFNTGMLLESFEADFETGTTQDLPLEWTSIEGTSSVYQYYKATHGLGALKLYGVDTVIMPMMQAGVVDMLRFDAYAQGNGEAKAIQVLASKTMEGPWDTVGIAVRPSGIYDMVSYEIDLSSFAGEPYYFAFTHLGAAYYSTSYIDYVRGTKLFKADYDLMANGFAGDSYVKDGDETILDVTLVNVGNMDIMGADYTVEIKTMDSVYFTVAGADLMANEEAMMEVPVMFATTDTLELYYEIVMDGEVRIDNNTSNKIQVIVTNLYVTEGETSGSDNNTLAMNRTNSISEMIYYPSEIGSYGNLNGIEFTYKYNYDEGNDTVPAIFYIATLTDSLLVDTVGHSSSYYSDPSWIETDSIAFTKVYDGMLDIQPGEGNSLYIPFDAPFAYDGTDNIILMIVKDSLNVGYKSLYIDKMASEHYRYAYGYNNDNRIDTDSIVTKYDGNISNYSVPNVKWHFDNPGAPVFESEPVTIAYEFADYTYDVEVDFVAGANPFTIEAAMLPEWLTLTVVDDTIATLSATAIDTVGVFSVQLVISDGTFSATQTFDVRVYGVPVFITEADTLAEAGMTYTYEMATTFNGVGVTEFVGMVMPEWLILTDNGDNTATLSTDSVAAKGEYNVSINAYGVSGATLQSFIITVDATPVFEAMDDITIKEATDYSATITVDDAGAVITAGENMDVTFTLTDNGDGTATVAGTALTVGEYVVDVVADNGNFSSAMSYVVTVGAVPVFTSEAITEAGRHEVYTYDAVVAYSGDDAVMLSADVPEWLTFTDNGDGTATLTGTPTGNFGSNVVSIIASGEYFYTTQTFIIDVVVGINDADANAFNIYPNPANNWVMVTDAENATVEILDVTGKLMFTQDMISGNERIDVSELNNGIYIITITNNNVTTSKRLVIE